MAEQISAYMLQATGDYTTLKGSHIILKNGEICKVIIGNSVLLKVGDGVTDFDSLPFVSAGVVSLNENEDDTVSSVVFNDFTNNKASGKRSVAFGYGTKSSNDNQASFGAYNKDIVGALFEVGCGSADDDRDNAFEVINDSNGLRVNVNNATLTGVKNPEYSVSSTSPKPGDTDAINYKFLKDYVTANTSAGSGISADVNLNGHDVINTDNTTNSAAYGINKIVPNGDTNSTLSIGDPNDENGVRSLYITGKLYLKSGITIEKNKISPSEGSTITVDGSENVVGDHSASSYIAPTINVGSENTTVQLAIDNVKPNTLNVGDESTNLNVNKITASSIVFGADELGYITVKYTDDDNVEHIYKFIGVEGE